jgi:hypothetical protein
VPSLSHLRPIHEGWIFRHHQSLHFCTNRATISSFPEKFNIFWYFLSVCIFLRVQLAVVDAISLRCRSLGLNFGFRQLKLLTPQHWLLQLSNYCMSIHGSVLPLIYHFDNSRVHESCFFCRRIKIMSLWPLYLLFLSRLTHFPQNFVLGILRCSRCSS